MALTNSTTYAYDPFDWSIWLFTLLSLTVTAALVTLLWHAVRKRIDDGGHTKLIFRLLKTVLVFQLIPFSTIFLRLLAVTEETAEGIEVSAFFQTPSATYFGRLLAVAWMAGIIWRIGKFADEWKSFRRFRSLCLPANEECTKLFSACKKELCISGSISLLVSKELSTPLLNGLFRPVVILPEDMMRKPEKLRDIFLHELIHHKQRDLLFKKLAALSGCIHWFNPLISTQMLQQVSKWAEFTCDEKTCAICESRKEYYETLYEAAVKRSGRELFSSALGEEKSELLVRIKRLERERSSKKIGTAAVIALTAALLLTGAVTAFGAGFGAVKVHQAVMNSIPDEEIMLSTDQESMDWFIENTQWENDEGREKDGANSFYCRILAGSAAVSPAFEKEENEKISVIIRVEPNDAETNVGIVTPYGKTVFVRGTGSIVHTFTARQTGEYRIYIHNNSATIAPSSTINVTGSYK